MQGQGPGRPKMQMEDVGKSTGNEDKDRGGDKEREEQKIPCQYDCGKTFDLKKKTGKANKARHEKECGKRAAEDYSGSKVDRSTRNDKKDRGGDLEREDAEDMSEFETRCWECKFGLASRVTTLAGSAARCADFCFRVVMLCFCVMIICCIICCYTL